MKKLILTTILTLSSYSSLFATSIKHTGMDTSRGLNIEIRADGSARNVNAGVNILLVDGLNLVDVFCVNLFTGITLNQTYAAMSIDADDYNVNGDSAAWLMETFLPVVNAAAGAIRQIDGAALQLAIWDLIHDGGDGFAAGRLRATNHTNSSVLAVANEWWLEALDKTGEASVYTALPGNRAFQQQMYLGESEVPEPSTLAMFGIGALAVIFGSWRRRNTAE